MSPTLILAALLAASASDPKDPTALDEYRAIAAKAGRGADAQVELALWCEAHGLDAERVKHLARAALSSPHHARARALLGMVRDGSQWRSPEKVAERLRADRDAVAALAEYDARRAQTPDTAEAHWRLALWCEQRGLRDEARAHLTVVTRLDPSRESAWRRLGCKMYQGRWMTPGEIASEKAEAEALQKADRHWGTHLGTLKRKLSGVQTRDSAETELAGLDDPRAARAVWRVFVTRSESDHRRAADLLGQLDGTDATIALGSLAVYSPFPSARGRATEALARRDSREAVGRLVDLLVTPLKYEIRDVGGPGQPGRLFVEGELFNIRRIYDAPLPRLSLSAPEPPPGFDAGPLLAARAVIRAAYSPPGHQGSSPVQTHQPQATQPPQHTSPPQVHQSPQAQQPPQAQHGGPGMHPGGGWPSYGGSPGAPIRSGGDVHHGGVTSNGNARPGGGMPSGGQQVVHPDGGHRPNSIPGAAPTGNPSSPGPDPFAAVESAMRRAMTNPTPMPILPPNDARPSDPQRDRDAEQRRREADRASAIERNWNEARRAAASAEQALEADLAAVVAYNDAAAEVNARVLPALQAATGRAEGPDRQAWKAWWADQRGYAYNRPEKPTYEDHADVYRPVFVTVPTTSTSCFGAGTPVRTSDGSRAIESLRVGDRVLTQDTRTGELGYQPVLGVFHNRPAPTLRIDLGGEVVVATPIHRFWRAGQGWALARELKPGDLVRTVGGTARVGEVTADIVRPVFNLEVAEGHTFFVGTRAALVHDNSPPRPHGRPFDATDVAASRPVAPRADRVGRPS